MDGIKSETILERIDNFGSNKMAGRPPKSFFELCIVALDDFVM